MELWPTDPDAACPPKPVGVRVRVHLRPGCGAPGRRPGCEHGPTELVAAAVVVDAATLEVTAQATVRATPTFPYVPGLFAFRNCRRCSPHWNSCLSNRTCTSATVTGWRIRAGSGWPAIWGLVDRPVFGVAKTALWVTPPNPVRRGSATDLVDRGEVVGRCLRVHDGVKPVYVSVGHRVDLDSACELVLRLSPRYRICEPIRRADQLSRRELAASGRA